MLWLSNRLKYVEQELAKKRGKNIDATNQVENDLKRAEDELYKIPEHLKVSYDSVVSIFSFLICGHTLTSGMSDIYHTLLIDSHMTFCI